MTVRELLAELQHLPRDLEVLAFEVGCDDSCEREVGELELQGGQVYLHLGARRDEPPRPWPPSAMAEVDPEQEAALRRLRAAFGFVLVLRIINDGQDQNDDESRSGRASSHLALRRCGVLTSTVRLASAEVRNLRSGGQVVGRAAAVRRTTACSASICDRFTPRLLAAARPLRN
jgi:hypothetical protein